MPFSKDPADYQSKGWYQPRRRPPAPRPPHRVVLAGSVAGCVVAAVITVATGRDVWSWVALAAFLGSTGHLAAELAWRRRLRRRASRTSR